MNRFALTCWLVIALGFLTGATQQPAVRQVVNGTGSSAGYYAATGSVISPTTAQTLDATTVLTRKDKVTAVSSNTTLGVHNVVYATIGSGGITLTLPAASSTTVGSYRIVIADAGVGNLTLAPNGSDKLNGVNASLTQTGQYTGYEVLWIDATNGWYVRRLSAAAGTGGTVTSIATTSPITGGTIIGSGTIACATCAVTTGTLAQFAATTSAQLAGVISNETGTGLLVFNDTPTLIAPLLGTPTSGTLTNTTGFPAANLAGLGTGVATFLATPTSANLAAALTNETGTGVAVFSDTPAFTTQVSITGAVTTPLMKFGVDSSNYAGFLWSRNIGDVAITQGAINNGADYVAQNTSAATHLMNSGDHYFFGDTGLTSGNTFNPTLQMLISHTGAVTISDLATTGAATGKTIVCADSAGRLYRSTSGVACAN